MSVIPKLASSLGRRDEVPNQQLAEQIVKKNDTKSVQELVEQLASKDKSIQSDCIKVLYEVGERKPKMIAPFTQIFLDLLENSSNRLVWGAMTALDAIVNENPEPVHESLSKILAVADVGTVITRDHAVGILTKLVRFKDYEDKAAALLMEQLRKCPPNQLPMYAENAQPAIPDGKKREFVSVLKSRIEELPKESQRKRVVQVLKRIEKRL